MSVHFMVCEVRSHKCDIAEQSSIPRTTTKEETERKKPNGEKVRNFFLGSGILDRPGTRIRMFAGVPCNMYSNTVEPQIANR
jgi:hypothetical protein